MDEQAHMRHAMRGYVNAMKLAIAVMDEPISIDESLTFLACIEKSADQITELIAQRESLPEPGVHDQS